MYGLLDILDKLSTPRLMLVALVLGISAIAMNVFSIFFLLYSRDSDRDPVAQKVRVLHSVEAPDPSEGEPKRSPNRSAAQTLREDPDTSTDDAKSTKRPKRAEDWASVDRLEADADARGGATQNEPPVVREAGTSPPPASPTTPSEASLVEGAPPTTAASVSPTVAPHEAPARGGPAPAATAPASAPATAPATAPAMAPDTATGYFSYSYSYSYR